MATHWATDNRDRLLLIGISFQEKSNAPVVRLKLRIRLPDGSRLYLGPVYAANNKLKPGYARLDGKPVHFPDGIYHLRYLKGSRRVWEGVGSDAQFALTAKVKREKSLDAKAVGPRVRT